MTDAAKKAEQRKRRKAGFEVFSLTVFKPKLIAWLVREELLKDVDRWDRDKITAALEAYLSARYDLPDVPGELQPTYAAGSFGREFTALRDLPDTRPHLTFPIPMGLLEREGKWEWREPPTRYLITRRNAVLRGIVDNDQHTRPGRHKKVEIEPLADPYDRRRWEGLEQYMLEDELAPPPDEYDPEDDVERVSADLMDEALADAFDADGFEKD